MSTVTARRRLDPLSPKERSERMSRVRGGDTAPELIVRRLAHRLGFRYRLHGAQLPGRPDMVFASRKAVVFVHGCFWHRHPEAGCKLARLPKSRPEFWVTKLEGNRARDERNMNELRALGWRALVIWECELRDTGHRERDLATVERRLVSFLTKDSI